MATKVYCSACESRQNLLFPHVSHLHILTLVYTVCMSYCICIHVMEYNVKLCYVTLRYIMYACMYVYVRWWWYHIPLSPPFRSGPQAGSAPRCQGGGAFLSWPQDLLLAWAEELHKGRPQKGPATRVLGPFRWGTAGRFCQNGSWMLMESWLTIGKWTCRIFAHNWWGYPMEQISCKLHGLQQVVMKCIDD